MENEVNNTSIEPNLNQFNKKSYLKKIVFLILIFILMSGIILFLIFKFNNNNNKMRFMFEEIQTLVESEYDLKEYLNFYFEKDDSFIITSSDNKIVYVEGNKIITTKILGEATLTLTHKGLVSSIKIRNKSVNNESSSLNSIEFSKINNLILGDKIILADSKYIIGFDGSLFLYNEIQEYGYYDYFHTSINGPVRTKYGNASKVYEDDFVIAYKGSNMPKDKDYYYFYEKKDINGLLLRDNNSFIAYKYDEINDSTKIVKYSIITGEIINSVEYKGIPQNKTDDFNFNIGEAIDVKQSLKRRPYIEMYCFQGNSCDGWYVIDLYTLEKIIPDGYKLHDLRYFQYVVVSKDNKFGLMDFYTKKLLISLEYDDLQISEKGDLLVATKDGKQGVINTKNEIIMPFDYYKEINTYEDYIAIAKNNTEVQVFKDSKQIIEYTNNAYPDNQIEFIFMDTFFDTQCKDYFYLEILWLQDCDNCNYEDAIYIVINGDKYIENVSPGTFNKINNNVVHNQEYIIDNIDGKNLKIYDKNLNFMFDTEFIEFNYANHINENYIALKKDRYSDAIAYIDLQNKKLVKDIKINEEIPYGINNLLNNKYIVKIINEKMNIYDLNNNLILSGDYQAITYLGDDCYVVLTNNDKFKILILDM